MRLFFRADDAGWGHERFARLAGLFAERGHRLNAAAIPVACRQSPPPLAPGWEGRLEFHSHGWAHLDHESAGRKCEFGESRRPEAAARELARSREELAGLFGRLYYPAFVPPWNRIAERFLPLLPAAGFRALSRDGAPRAGVPGLAELNVSIDLHTARAPGPGTPEELLEAAAALAPGRPAVGVMLHHARMSERDFSFLDALLVRMTEHGDESVLLSELAG